MSLLVVLYVDFAAPARLPSFHTCVGANDERLTPKWYQEHGNYLEVACYLSSITNIYNVPLVPS